MKLFVQIAPFYQMNLTSDYFASSGARFVGDNELQVKLIKNPLSKMIRKGMACEVHLEERPVLRGRVERVSEQGNAMAISFLLAGNVIMKKEKV